MFSVNTINNLDFQLQSLSFQVDLSEYMKQSDVEESQEKEPMDTSAEPVATETDDAMEENKETEVPEQVVSTEKTNAELATEDIKPTEDVKEAEDNKETEIKPQEEMVKETAKEEEMQTEWAAIESRSNSEFRF